MRKPTIQLNIINFFTILLTTTAIVYFILLFIVQNELKVILVPISLLFIMLFIFLLSKDFYLLIFISTILPAVAMGFLPQLSLLLFIIVATFLIFLKRIDSITTTDKHKNFLGKTMNFLLIFLIISVIYAILRGWSNATLFRGFIWFVIFTLLIYTFSIFIDSEEKVRKIGFWLLIGFLIAGTFFIFISLQFYGKTVITVAGRILNKNAMGMIFAPASLFCIGIFITEKEKKKIFLLLPTLVILILNLLVTKSRGAWLGFVAGLIYIIIKNKSYKWFIYIAILIVLVGFFEQFQSILFERVKQTSIVDPALLTRFYIWGSALSTLKGNFIFGVGIHNFLNIKYLYGFPKWLDPTGVFFTHNLYLEFLVDTGIFGFLFFMTLIIKSMRRLNTISGGHYKLKGFALGINGAIISYLVHGFFDYCFWFYPALILLAWFLGLTIALDNLHTVAYN
jgi:O-antigen ligase